MSTLHVFWDDKLVGHLSSAGGPEMTFQYSAHYLARGNARAISLSLPLQAEAFDPASSKSWFANLLPEGEIRGHVARRLGVSARNEYAILDGIGGDCAGALRLIPEAHQVDQKDGLVPLPWDELEAKIAATPRPSLLALVLQNGELRLSLAGAQDKLPVHFSRGELALPSGDIPSTHLLKVSSGDFPGLVENELFCLKLAKKAGLDVPHAELAPTETPILLVQRYDRRVHADGRIGRLHQEDFCQALGIPPETKYENEGGPSLAQLFGVLSRGSRSPLPDKKKLLQWVFFNFLIGNADTHAKNISFLHGEFGERGGPRLAPFYDLVCTQVYEQLSPRLAQKIGGEYRHRYVAGRHWDRLAEAIGVKPGYLRATGLEMCGRVEGGVESVFADLESEAWGGEVLEQIAEVIDRRIRRVRGRLGG